MTLRCTLSSIRAYIKRADKKKGERERGKKRPEYKEKWDGIVEKGNLFVWCTHSHTYRNKSEPSCEEDRHSWAWGIDQLFWCKVLGRTIHIRSWEKKCIYSRGARYFSCIYICWRYKAPQRQRQLTPIAHTQFWFISNKTTRRGKRAQKKEEYKRKKQNPNRKYFRQLPNGDI